MLVRAHQRPLSNYKIGFWYDDSRDLDFNTVGAKRLAGGNPLSPPAGTVDPFDLAIEILKVMTLGVGARTKGAPR